MVVLARYGSGWNNNKTCIIPCHILLAIRNDKELKSLLAGITIPHAGPAASLRQGVAWTAKFVAGSTASLCHRLGKLMRNQRAVPLVNKAKMLQHAGEQARVWLWEEQQNLHHPVPHPPGDPQRKGAQ
ncbi:hypothetical protein EJB05_34252, partial [Eragrostis curvula]